MCKTGGFKGLKGFGKHPNTKAATVYVQQDGSVRSLGMQLERSCSSLSMITLAFVGMPLALSSPPLLFFSTANPSAKTSLSSSLSCRKASTSSELAVSSTSSNSLPGGLGTSASPKNSPSPSPLVLLSSHFSPSSCSSSCGGSLSRMAGNLLLLLTVGFTTRPREGSSSSAGFFLLLGFGAGNGFLPLPELCWLSCCLRSCVAASATQNASICAV